MNHLRQRNQKLDHPAMLQASFCFLGVWSIHKSHGSHFLSRNWKFMWKPYTGSIFDFMDKKFSLVIFWTSFSKNWPFLLLFSKILILSKLTKGIDKICSKYGTSIYFKLVLPIYHIALVEIRIFEKSGKNGQFFTKWSPKNH